MPQQTTESQQQKPREEMMTAYQCGVCGYIAIDGSIPEKCPSCGAPKTAFKEKKDLNTREKFATYAETEKKHFPVINVVKKCGLIPEGCLDVHVRIGEIMHPMLVEHYIQKIDFYLDRKFISRITFSPLTMNPAASLHMKATSGTFTAIEHCNIHGAWISETAI